jgi:DNA-3-methyladenine glycosylase I
MRGMKPRRRCGWVPDDPLYIRYHDDEWGRPVHDDRRLFEFLVLEGAQAGLSWSTILRKREGYRRAFAKFNPRRVASFDGARIEKLLQNPDIVRNRAKITAAIDNAAAFLEVQRTHGSFDAFAWGFVGGRTLHRRPRTLRDVPARTEESDALSEALRKLGFRFVGSTICYAFMQACGLVDDHVRDCFRAYRPPVRLRTVT